ncbi:DUF3631 domain-containing protein [Pelobacter propionicus]|uniref:DUF3631 domain-containing protein n=1 Tax=Pelobacter propionicus (strain DSM 2379 / NBRC 103807 / OttBd1) TaxID=338966 RepID=A1ARD5_PELPD|nr:DUF3631 domain-containing protein [Pelobacter propionicus]ABK99905.1 hypothetical protein Ppro_2298 [Pelobacter propionicus DSM 2379]
MNPYVDRFFDCMNKLGDSPAKKDIFKNGQLQSYDVNGERRWYILDIEEPAVGLYGSYDGSVYRRWAPKRKDDQEEAIYKKKLKEMKDQIKEALASAQISNTNIAPETIDLTDVGLTDEFSVNNVDSDITRLATMPPLDYEHVRKDEASRLNVRMSILDKEVAKQRKFINKAKFLGPRLLNDIYHIFKGSYEDRIRSEDLINSLCVRNKLWATYNQGEQINFKQISDILKLYGIQSKEIRFGDKTYKGYTRELFADAFSSPCHSEIKQEKS